VKPDNARLAVVEDDPHLRADLLEFLLWRRFNAEGFASGEAFDAAHAAHPFDLVLLDIGLPWCSGLDVAQRLQAHAHSHNTHMPGIVMLTALGTDEDRIAGLTRGADAYLVKGTSLQIIEATCLNLLGRLRHNGTAPAFVPIPTNGWSKAPSQTLAHGLQPRLPNLHNDLPSDWVVHPRTWQLSTPTGEKLRLTHLETQFLEQLVQNPGQPVSRTALLKSMGKADTLSNLRNLDNCASRLRRKVMSTCALELPVRPSYGRGYTFTGAGRMESAWVA
jgi:DNA-binding response OmpR family regulator